MICLDNTDVIEGGAATDAVVQYTMHGLVGTTFTQLAAGVMGTTLTTALYTASSAVSVVSIILVNTHSSAVAVTLRLDPADGGNPIYIIPKTISLGAGYSLHTDGARITVMNENGVIVTGENVSDTAYNEATWNAVTAIAPSKNVVRDELENRAPKATPTFTGQATIPTIDLTGGQIAFPASQAPSADPNTQDDYEEGTWTPLPADAYTGGNTEGASTATGTYTKIGDVVIAQVYLINIDTTTLTAGNDFYIQGLPFAVPAGTGYSGSSSLANVTFAGFVTLEPNPGSASLRFRESVSGAAADFLVCSQIGDGTADIVGTFIYKV